MWRVDWCGSFSEFSQIFNTKEEAVEFYNSLISSRKTIYKAFQGGDTMRTIKIYSDMTEEYEIIRTDAPNQVIEEQLKRYYDGEP